MNPFHVLFALALLGSAIRSEEICDCEKKPKCGNTDSRQAAAECPGGRGRLMVPGGPDCSCCEAVCPRRRGERCEEHKLSCDHGLSCTEAGICGDNSHAVELTALSATNNSLTLGWRGPSGYMVQYREANGRESPGTWQRLEKLTESPESNVTLVDLAPGTKYEARALLPGVDGNNPVAAVEAETGCDCPRPFFRIGSFKDDSECTERPMPDRPCCALVVCAASQTSEESSTEVPTTTSTAQPTTAAVFQEKKTTPSDQKATPTVATPVNGTTNTTCVYKNKTRSSGEVFHDGCEHKCSCQEGGNVTCMPRCSEMTHNVSSKCVSLPDPKDVCCTIVLCDVTLEDQDTSPTQVPPSETKPASEAPSAFLSSEAGGCTHNGHRYGPGEEFHDGCRALCACSPTGQLDCAPILCPTDSGLDVLDPHCVAWEAVPMEPEEKEGSTPTCCPEVRCRDNGSCEYSGQRFDNFAEIPTSVAGGCSGHRCFCEFGNVTCGGGGGPTKCPPVPAGPPHTLECQGGAKAAVLAHPPGDDCCLAWVCAAKADVSPGSTNSSSGGPVPETMMIPQMDEVTLSTNDKSRPMTTSNANLTDPEMDIVTKLKEVNMTRILMNIITTSSIATDKFNMTSDVSHQNSTITTPAKSTYKDASQNITITQNSYKEQTIRESDQAPISTTPLIQVTMTTNEPNVTTISIQETDKEASTGTPLMQPIIVENHPTYTSPWENILNKENGPPNKNTSKHLPFPGPVKIPDDESVISMHVETQSSSEENEPDVKYYGIPYAPNYLGPSGKQPPQTDPFHFIHDTPNVMPVGLPRHPIVNENAQNFPVHHNFGENVDDGRLPNATMERPQQQQDNIPIFLRYPVQEGKRQKTAPQKIRIPEHPGNIPSKVNEFQYQGPFLGAPPSGHDDRILFQPHEENIRPISNFPRPGGNNANKNIGNNRQQSQVFRQPNHPINNFPRVREEFPGPLIIHQKQGGPPSGPASIPAQVPGSIRQPSITGINGNGVRQPLGAPSPDHFHIQDLEGGHLPPEVAQHILWALQGRPSPGVVQGVQQHPSQQSPQNHGLPPPPRGASRGSSRPQNVFFHLPTGVGSGNPPRPEDIFIQNQEPVRHRNPPRIPQAPVNQRTPPNQNGQFTSGPPHFLPGVEPSLLPPELYHLAFPPGEHLRNRTQAATTSLVNAQPHMTHDHAHLTEDLPLIQAGTEFGRPPPPPRFPDVPINPQLHPHLHNVGASSPSDEIAVDAADVLPDSSVHLVFSLPSIFVGLHGQVEISYTEDPLKDDPMTWEGKETVSTPNGLIESRRLEYTIPGSDEKNGLQPNKNYRIIIALLLRDLRNSPTSRVINIRTPSKPQESTTQLPPQIEVDAELGIAEVNATWARFVWRKFNDFELQFIDGVQLRYKEIEGKVYSTTQLLHRATGSYTLEGLRPSSTYEVGLLLVPFPGQKTELIARENLHITTAAEKDPYGFDLKIKVDSVKVFSVEVSWSGVPYPEDKYVNIFRVIYQSDSASTKGGEGSDGADGEERSSTFKVAKRDPSPSALVTGLKPGTRYRMWLEAYLTNGRIKKSDVKDIVTKPSSSSSTTKQGKLEASVGEVGNKSSDNAGDYYGGLVGVSILAALAFVAILVLLLMLLKRQGQAKKAAISTARKSESAYDNPTYKTSDHDSTNGRIKNSVRLQEA